MSASLRKDIREEVKRELEASYVLIRTLSESITKLELRLKVLEEKRGPGRPRNDKRQTS